MLTGKESALEYVVTAAEMQSADYYTSDGLGLPQEVLMERAALGAADEICKRFQERKAPVRVCIVCGTGNNGGDGFALGRILNERGFFVHFFMAGDQEKASKANELQRKILSNLGLVVSTGQPTEEYDIIVDAIFGTGLRRKIEGTYRDMIKSLNEKSGFKVALDIPSGICADSGKELGCAFCADLTVTFGFYKWGHLLYPGKSFCKEVVCKDIGITEKSFDGRLPAGRMIKKEDMSLLPVRIPDSHKGTYKKAGVIAGSEKMGGAAVLCSTAAMKTGVGYVKVMTHFSNRDLILSRTPEALVYIYGDYTTHPMERLRDCSAVAIGPGIGVSEEMKALMEGVFESYDSTLILDADAINLLAKYPDLKEALKRYAAKIKNKGKKVILTPHKREFCRFCGISTEDDFRAEHKRALETAEEYDVIIVLKDAVTRIYIPGGTVYVNTTGNPGMSTAGSGDVLTGILAGLLAQMEDDAMAAALSVYIHGLCGDFAAKEGNPYSMTAMDIAEGLKYVLKEEA